MKTENETYTITFFFFNNTFSEIVCLNTIILIPIKCQEQKSEFK